MLNTTPTPYKFEKNEELISQLTVAQNTLKVLQEAFNSVSSKLVELERKHKLVQYSRRKCLKFSDIPSSVAPKDLKNFPICLFQEIGIDLDKLWIVACHRLAKMDRTIIKFLNRKDAENVFLSIMKLKDVDISCLLSDSIQDRNNITTEGQHDRRGRTAQKKE